MQLESETLAPSVKTEFPISNPKIVIKVDIHINPIAGRFMPTITLSPGTSVDHACVTLPDPSPAVTTARLDPCTPCPIWHLTDVSETHSVASHPVPVLRRQRNFVVVRRR